MFLQYLLTEKEVYLFACVVCFFKRVFATRHLMWDCYGDRHRLGNWPDETQGFAYLRKRWRATSLLQDMTGCYYNMLPKSDLGSNGIVCKWQREHFVGGACRMHTFNAGWNESMTTELRNKINDSSSRWIIFTYCWSIQSSFKEMWVK
jgi:hypothetical protein